ncbi:MAG: hypothetical protein L0H23_10695, partial [Luteimonas sp.]|nr:hypothetical protein [Luteimonas sp.]
MTPRLTPTCLFAALLCVAFTCAAQAPPPDDQAMDADETAQLQAMQAAAGTYYARTAAELAASGKPRDL